MVNRFRLIFVNCRGSKRFKVVLKIDKKRFINNYLKNSKNLKIEVTNGNTNKKMS